MASPRMWDCTRWASVRGTLFGLGAALSARIVPAGERFPLHDRGKVLVARDADIGGCGDRVVRMWSSCGRSRCVRAGSPSDSNVVLATYPAASSAGTRPRCGKAMAEGPCECVVGGRYRRTRSCLDIDATGWGRHSIPKTKEGTAVRTTSVGSRLPPHVLFRGF